MDRNEEMIICERIEYESMAQRWIMVSKVCIHGSSRNIIWWISDNFDWIVRKASGDFWEI